MVKVRRTEAETTSKVTAVGGTPASVATLFVSSVRTVGVKSETDPETTTVVERVAAVGGKGGGGATYGGGGEGGGLGSAGGGGKSSPLRENLRIKSHAIWAVSIAVSWPWKGMWRAFGSSMSTASCPVQPVYWCRMYCSPLTV